MLCCRMYDRNASELSVPVNAEERCDGLGGGAGLTVDVMLSLKSRKWGRQVIATVVEAEEQQGLCSLFP
jgi:hypothetical protein